MLYPFSNTAFVWHAMLAGDTSFPRPVEEIYVILMFRYFSQRVVTQIFYRCTSLDLLVL